VIHRHGVPVIHRHGVKVRFYELDPYNHLNHAAYIQYFEVGRVEMLEAIGFGLSAIQQQGVHLVVTGIATRFLASAGPHDEVVIESSVESIRRATSTWSQRILRGDSVLATQTVDVAATDWHGKPTRLPSDLVEALQPYLHPGP
jgi:acyl-CoA thioester hydrolase